MHRQTILAAIIALAAFAAVANRAQAQHGHDDAKPAIDRAVAVMLPVGDSKVTGVVYFTRSGKTVQVSGKITGLTPGLHGFHVHQFGDITGMSDGLSAGGHFNPEDTKHGDRHAEERHVGDLGNIKADDEGVATIDFKDTKLALDGPHSILGRSLVVHANEDKFTQPVGDAGGRVALGVIGVAAPPKE